MMNRIHIQRRTNNLAHTYTNTHTHSYDTCSFGLTVN